MTRIFHKPLANHGTGAVVGDPSAALVFHVMHILKPKQKGLGSSNPTFHLVSKLFSVEKKSTKKKHSDDRPTKIPQTRLEPAEFSFPPSTLAFPLFFGDCATHPCPNQNNDRNGRPETCPKSLVSATRPCLAIPVASSSRVPWLLKDVSPLF